MKDKANKAPLSQVISSVFSAMIGVQSNKNRERDFKAANPKTYLFAGIAFTLIFITTIITVVNFVID